MANNIELKITRRRLFFDTPDKSATSEASLVGNDTSDDEEWFASDGFSSTTHSTTSVSSKMFGRLGSSDEETSDDESGVSALPKPKAEAFDDELLAGIDAQLSFASTGFPEDSFRTPPSSPRTSPKKVKDTPSPVKTAVKAVREHKGSPSKLPNGDRVVDGLRSTFREELDDDKASEVQERVVTLVVSFLFKGQDPHSPKGHEYCILYINTLEWAQDFFDVISRKHIPCQPIFDIPHLKGEMSPDGKLSGGHFQGPTLQLQSSVTSKQETICGLWSRLGASQPKRSSIFPSSLTPTILISEFSDSPVKVRRANRSIRIIEGLCVETYHRGVINRSAFPIFYYNRFEIDKTYEITEEVSVTSSQILDHVKAMDDTAFPSGINPIEFYNSQTQMCVVDIASRLGIATVDKGIYFEVPASEIIAKITQEHFEDLIEEVK